MAPTFRNASGGNISVQDIKLTGDLVIEWADACYILDASGAPKEGMTFLWTTDNGWVNDQSEPATATLAPGEGIVVNTTMEGVGIMFAGEVGTKDLKLISGAGQNFIGNASPVEIGVQEMTLSGDLVIEWADACYILDASGAPKEGMTFLWTSDNGWVNDASEPATATLAPGEGIVVNTTMEGVEINLPGVTL